MVTYAPQPLARRRASLVGRFDVVVSGASIALAILGVVMVYSATRVKLALSGTNPHYYLDRQAVFVVIGIVVMVGVALFDYRRLEPWATVLYVGTVFALLGVFVVGSHALGSQRWYALGPLQLQPSEFATLTLIVAIATYCARRPEGLVFRDLVRLVLMVGVPALMIIKQPDLGTGIVVSIILLVMLAVAGMPGRYLLLLVVGATVVVVVALQVGLLQKYQIQRLTSFISPNSAGETATYNVTQAKNAIGSGGLLGTGVFRGAQTNLSYVPFQQTDFIFSAVGEQLGFVGGAITILVYGLLGWRILRIAQQSKDIFGRMICGGVFALLTFSVFENVGMNMGIMPVAGIPLPFLSYGGSAAIVFFIAAGLVQSVRARSIR
ncbi:MAG: rod shape-determining protein RodA [Actinomycetota bacterium]|nr:rod shape-determining protein RodA [Actinomycetota bacterium]MDA8294733.1 rod shape-determining protein RodA [Actinomycetota bacterium]